MLNVKNFDYTLSLFYDENSIKQDIIIEQNGKKKRVLGRRGIETELFLVQREENITGAIFIGAGTGAHIQYLLDKGVRPLVVVDKKNDILKLWGEYNSLLDEKDIYFITETDTYTIQNKINEIIEKYNRKISIFFHPAYTNLDFFYKDITYHIDRVFASKNREKDSQKKKVRILLLKKDYFVSTEIENALKGLSEEIEYTEVDVGQSIDLYIPTILKKIENFRPDFILAVNHMGFDYDGKLLAVINKAQLPVASWFVDSPELILDNLSYLKYPNVGIFTWDRGFFPFFKEQGYENISYLPLATDFTQYKIGKIAGKQYSVAFVGNSWTRQIEKIDINSFPKILTMEINNLVEEYSREKPHFLPAKLLKSAASRKAFSELDSKKKRAYQESIVWRATGIYRRECVLRSIPYKPIIMGDNNWGAILPGHGKDWKWKAPVPYGIELAKFYRQAKININCISLQLYEGVNQRVFDVPAVGGFLITDHQKCLEELFAEDEYVSYKSFDELEDKLAYYIDKESERIKIAEKARKRIEHEHSYVIRLRTLIAQMREWYYI